MISCFLRLFFSYFPRYKFSNLIIKQFSPFLEIQTSKYGKWYAVLETFDDREQEQLPLAELPVLIRLTQNPIAVVPVRGEASIYRFFNAPQIPNERLVFYSFLPLFSIKTNLNYFIEFAKNVIARIERSNVAS